MSIMRWIFGAPVVVTAALFVLMAGLIRQDLRLEPAKAIPDFSIVAKIPEPEIKPESGKDEPTLPEAPPPILPRIEKSAKPEGAFELPTPGAVDPGSIGPIGGQATAPTIRVAPAYPERCAAQNIEGVALVQFDVTPEGDVVNPRILSSPHSCFDRTVIRAVSRWKYAPAYENGRPVARRGVVERFVFELTE
ncbi:MAG: hypothetical protein Kow00133_15940 [Amphiplicatus sp.]